MLCVWPEVILPDTNGLDTVTLVVALPLALPDAVTVKACEPVAVHVTVMVEIFVLEEAPNKHPAEPVIVPPVAHQVKLILDAIAPVYP